MVITGCTYWATVVGDVVRVRSRIIFPSTVYLSALADHVFTKYVFRSSAFIYELVVTRFRTTMAPWLNNTKTWRPSIVRLLRSLLVTFSGVSATGEQARRPLSADGLNYGKTAPSRNRISIINRARQLSFRSFRPKRLPNRRRILHLHPVTVVGTASLI